MVAIAALGLQGCVAHDAGGVAAAPGAPSAGAGACCAVRRQGGADEASPLSAPARPGRGAGQEGEAADGGQLSAAGPDTLRGTVLTALGYNAKVKRGIADLAKAGVEVSVARSGYLPTLESTAGLSNTADPDYKITLDQPVFDWGRTPARVDEAKAGVAAAEAELKVAREETAYDAAEAFIDVKRNEELVEAARDDVAVHEHILQLARDRSKGGVGDSSEVELAGVRLGEARSALQEMLGALRHARSIYYTRVGRMPGRLGEVPELALKPSAISAPETAATHAPGVIAARARAEAAQEAVKAERASLLPKLSVEGYVRDDGDRRGQYTGFGLRLTGPTVTGFANVERVRAAKLAAESAKWDVENARREAASRVKEFIDRAPTLREKVAILERQITKAKALRDVYEDQFKVGERSLVDLVNAQSDINRITRDRIDARYDDVLLQYGAAAALGRLERELGLAPQGGFDGE